MTKVYGAKYEINRPLTDNLPVSDAVCWSQPDVDQVQKPPAAPTVATLPSDATALRIEAPTAPHVSAIMHPAGAHAARPMRRSCRINPTAAAWVGGVGGFLAAGAVFGTGVFLDVLYTRAYNSQDTALSNNDNAKGFFGFIMSVCGLVGLGMGPLFGAAGGLSLAQQCNRRADVRDAVRAASHSGV